MAMKVLIIGATGKIGRLTVQEALNLGYQVTAFGRAVDRIKSAQNLSIAQGDVRDAGSVQAAVHGHEAVIMTFGAIPDFKTLLLGTDICEVGTRNVLAAMKRANSRRLIAMTSIGAGDSSGHGSWAFRNIVKPIILGRVMKDRTRQEELVRSSALSEWVIIRPSELTDGPRSEQLRLFKTFDGQSEPSSIARASVAAFLAKAITDQSHDKSSVVISE
jgi:putative NADH-flavin reductase